jgi:HAE1 family hydrophobic/amphiphilic exporter-1
MNIVDFSIRRAVTTSMLILALVVFGVVSYSRLAVNLLPDITYPSLTVKTVYEGAAPSEVEDVITKPIEEAVGVVNNIVRVSSVSRAGESYVILEFAWKTNMDFAGLNVREKLDLVQLPDGAEKPVLLKYDPSSDPILRLGATGNLNLAQIRLLAEEKIKPYLENIEGVAAVKVNGGLEEEIYVELDPGKLNTFNLPINQITQRLAQENINLSGGILDEGRRRFLVRTLSQFKTVSEIGDVIVARRGAANVLLRDIGHVYSGYKDRTVITKLNGKEVIELAVYKAADANTILVADAVKQRMQELLPDVNVAGTKLELTPVFDQSVFIRQAVDEVLSTAVQGGILAVIVLFLFLRNLKSTAIISLSIPLSVVITFFFMYLFDLSLNIMSLGGLALGIGMLVDNSIVVLESIQRFREQGLGALEASLKGASDVGMAVTASTLTTICVFLPIVFVEGVARQLFADQALTVTFSLSASLLVSLTLIPMLSSRGLPVNAAGSRAAGADPAPAPPAGVGRRIVRAVFFTVPAAVVGGTGRLLRWIWQGVLVLLTPLTWTFNVLWEGLSRVYSRLLLFALDHRTLVLGVAVSLLAVSILIYPFLGSELIPEVRQGQLSLNLNRVEGTPIANTQETVDLLMREINRVPGVQGVYAVTGLSTQSGVSVEENKENAAWLYIQMADTVTPRQEDGILDGIRTLVAPLPGLEYKFSRPTFFSFKSPIEVYVQGYNPRVLAQLASRITREMAGIRGLTDLKASTDAGNPEVQIVFNRERLSAYGLTIQGVATVLRNQILGDVATSFVRPDRKVDIRVRLPEDRRQTLPQIRNLKIHDNAGNIIPLTTVARLEVAEGPAEIRRLNQQRVALISGNLEGRDLAGAVMDIRRVLDATPMPPNFTAFLGGQSEEQMVAFRSMAFAILLAVFLIYLVMASQFESLIQPFIIMFSIPFSVVGVLLTLWLTRQTISVVVFIGAIILAGIVVNNAIVLLDCINHLRAGGLAKREAIIEACRLRLRPIMMTTATTVLGLLPMAVGMARGAELRKPLALTIIGGLTSSTLLTLVLIPVLYLWLVKEK